MDIILKKAMLHYLNSRIALQETNLISVESQEKALNKDYTEERLCLASVIQELELMRLSIKNNLINKPYDTYCIKNGLSRTGARFSV